MNRLEGTRETVGEREFDVREPGGAASARKLALVAFGVLGFIVLSAVYLGTAALPLDPVSSFALGDLAFILPIATTIVTGWIAFRRSRGEEARFWLLLSCANVVLLASELYFVWWVVSAGTPPPPVYAPFQIMHLIAAGLFLTLVLSLTKFQNATATQRARYLVDLVATVTVAYVAVLVLVVDPLFRPLSGVMPVDRVAGAAYPIWGLLVIGGTLTMLLGFKVSRWRAWEKFVALSLVIYSLGIASWPLWYVSFKTDGASLQRGVLDLVLLLGHYLLTIATVYRVAGGGQQWPLRPTPLFQPMPRGRLSYVVPAVTLFAMPFLVYLALGSGADPLDRTVYTIAASLLAIVTVSRTALVAVENGRLLHRSVTDPLTGLFNHRFFHERLGVELDVATRYSETLSLLVLDLDDFDIVNKLQGHPAGDDLLRRTATAIRAACRDSDPVCRIGGDEFAVILPGAQCGQALSVALRIREELRAVETFDHRTVTVSAGIACFPTHSAEATELARLADGAAYWVKHHGKDQTLVFDPDIITDMNSDERIRTLVTQTHLGTVRALAAAVDARDPDTQYHSRNVAAMATQVARELGLEENRCSLLEMAGLMHDIGKIGVPDDILRKEGPLDADEMTTVRGHSELGERILTSTAMDDVLPWIRHHHERWDGEGYPDGLRAVAIPLEARILAVCDAWDAMISGRPYRAARSRAEATAELAANMGTQFDPAVVEVFLRTVGAPAPESGVA